MYPMALLVCLIAAARGCLQHPDKNDKKRTFVFNHKFVTLYEEIELKKKRDLCFVDKPPTSEMKRPLANRLLLRLQGYS
jgi:hypothetical protein